MKQLIFVFILCCFAFGQDSTTATKIIRKGDTFKADQDYRLMTASDMVKINEKLIDSKTLAAKELDYKNIIKNDSLQMNLITENKVMYKEMLDSYKNLWLDAQDELARKSYTKWYDNKAIWFTLGIAATFLSSEIVANVK